MYLHTGFMFWLGSVTQECTWHLNIDVFIKGFSANGKATWGSRSFPFFHRIFYSFGCPPIYFALYSLRIYLAFLLCPKSDLFLEKGEVVVVQWMAESIRALSCTILCLPGHNKGFFPWIFRFRFPRISWKIRFSAFPGKIGRESRELDFTLNSQICLIFYSDFSYFFSWLFNSRFSGKMYFPIPEKP
jgi:hypothetical protein